MSPGEQALIHWVAVGGAYVILWWMTFFMLLPVGLYNEDDPPGQFTLGEAPKPKSERAKPGHEHPPQAAAGDGDLGRAVGDLLCAGADGRDRSVIVIPGEREHAVLV